MQSLTEKYRPEWVKDFCGMPRTKAVLRALGCKPYNSAWLFVGAAGTGKTTIAMALAKGIGAELHHIPSRSCNLETVEEVVKRCWYKPFFGDWHLVLIDEADQMTKAAQHAFLSKLDATAFPPMTIFVFTANSTAGLEDRFLSRLRTLEFGAVPVPEMVDYLRMVWTSETAAAVPDLQAIADGSGGNLRQALMDLELELMIVKAGERFDVTTGAVKAA